MMGRQAQASVRVMRLWQPHDPGRSCLRRTIRHHLTNETDLQNAGALPPHHRQTHRNLAAACENFGLDVASSWPKNLLADPQARIEIGGAAGSYRARPAASRAR
jgi:hypothetical protein